MMELRRRGSRRNVSNRAVYVICMAAIGAACSDGLTVEDLREPLEPFLVYQTYFDLTINCVAGVPELFVLIDFDFDRIRWFVTDRFPDGEGILGQWNSRHEITLKRGFELNKGVIMHEILHDQLSQALGGDGAHSSPVWELCESWGLLLGVDG